MKKEFCDRCNKEIKPRKILRHNRKSMTDWFIKTDLESWGSISHQYELCSECTNKLKRFLGGGEFEFEGENR